VILAAGLAIALAAPLGPCRPTVSAATARGDVAILVEVADTPAKRQRGLMLRTSLAPKTGMWFIFSNEKVRRFWMRNTLIPLDIIYVSAAGLVVSIIRRATPESDRSLPSEKPALYVLELAGGEARRLGIEVGNKLSVCGVAGPS
jgi:uncharacterized membrane protein (UPF0127 family)